ncbi:hypothetical protein GDO86_006839 [Hymenochirus boettgeri]|uniref:Uncharacterized protein n=1 Tax=Hymenochirus boettgeri TaxID=247094 RepID=A0A8T2JA74_9PIPI|nr:hypothetical protein GDO86_006839 [Hymenochirus boettgeri]
MFKQAVLLFYYVWILDQHLTPLTAILCTLYYGLDGVHQPGLQWSSIPLVPLPLTAGVIYKSSLHLCCIGSKVVEGYTGHWFSVQVFMAFQDLG